MLLPVPLEFQNDITAPPARLNKYASDDVKCMCGPLSLPAAVEDELVKHVKDLDDMMFGMTAKDMMGLAREVSVAHGIRKFSEVKKSAGKKWYYNFMRRHPDLYHRSPEPTSLARAAGFNREAVYNFFDLLEKLIDEHNFTPAKIYNVGDTGHSTVQTPTKGKRRGWCYHERGAWVNDNRCILSLGHWELPGAHARVQAKANLKHLEDGCSCWNNLCLQGLRLD